MGSSDEIHVKLHGTPCCDTEFKMFVTLLRKARESVGTRPFFLLYDLNNCHLQSKYITAQEDVLDGAVCCAILASSTAKRVAIRIAVQARKKSSVTTIFSNRASGILWLQKKKAEFSILR
jgi:phosphoribosylformylglycinamidine (FGAM) synthase-like enzyme